MVTTGVRRMVIAGTVAAMVFLLGGCTSETTAATGAEVEVDLYSGRENPVVKLDTQAATELRELVDAHLRDAREQADAEGTLGFRGLVVTFVAPGDGPDTVRILPTEVVFVDADGAHRIEDTSGRAFDLVWTSIRGELEPQVVDAVEQ